MITCCWASIAAPAVLFSPPASASPRTGPATFRYQHEGHVFIHVIKGEAVYGCGASDFPMGAGDSLSFDAKLPHGFRRIISEEIEFITVSTRPH